MMQQNWQTQKNEPLFPDILWSRPENRNGAGKLLIVGGSADNLANVAQSYTMAEQAGVGACFLLVPESLQKVTKNIPFIHYGPANRSGSFAERSLSEMLDLAKNVDGIMLAGNMGKNSETSLTLDKFLSKYRGLLGINSSSLESLSLGWQSLLARDNTILEIDIKTLQQIGISLSFDKPITSDSPNWLIAESLSKISMNFPTTLALYTNSTIWLAQGSQVIACDQQKYNFCKGMVWAIQQPKKQLQAIATSIIE